MKTLILVFLILSLSSNAKEIAITFDDAPRKDSYFMKGDQRSEKLIKQLAQQGVTAMFFVVTGRVTEETKSRLVAYKKAGHWLANHGHHHLNLHKTKLELFQADFNRAHRRLKGFPKFLRHYRFPFLNEGESKSKRDAVRKWLDEKQLSHGYVTVDNYDWYMEHLLQRAIESNKTIHWDRLKEVYIE